MYGCKTFVRKVRGGSEEEDQKVYDMYVDVVETDNTLLLVQREAETNIVWGLSDWFK